MEIRLGETGKAAGIRSSSQYWIKQFRPQVPERKPKCYSDKGMGRASFKLTGFR